MAEIHDGDLLLRQVHKKNIRPNGGGIHRYAYRPRLDEGKDHDGVSIELRKLYKDPIAIEAKWFNFGVYEVTAEVIRNRKYNCVHYNDDNNPHGLVIGDMADLFKDDETLEYFCSNSVFVAPVKK